MRRAAALTLTLAALGGAGCGDDAPTTDTVPADMPAGPEDRNPNSEDIAPDADGGGGGDPAE